MSGTRISQTLARITRETCSCKLECFEVPHLEDWDHWCAGVWEIHGVSGAYRLGAHSWHRGGEKPRAAGTNQGCGSSARFSRSYLRLEEKSSGRIDCP